MFSGGLPVTRSDTTPVSAAVFVITDHAFNLTSAEVRPDAMIVPMLPFSCVAVATLCTTAICPAWYPCVAVSVSSPACVVSEATARTFEIAAVGAGDVRIRLDRNIPIRHQKRRYRCLC